MAMVPDALADLLEDGVVVTDAEGRIVWANAAFGRICGHAPDALTGERADKLLKGPQTALGDVARIQQALNDRQPVEAELLNYHACGRPFWARMNCRPVHNRDGSFQGFAARIVDTTISRARNALDEAVERIDPGEDVARHLALCIESLERLLPCHRFAIAFQYAALGADAVIVTRPTEGGALERETRFRLMHTVLASLGDNTKPEENSPSIAIATAADPNMHVAVALMTTEGFGPGANGHDLVRELARRTRFLGHSARQREALRVERRDRRHAEFSRDAICELFAGLAAHYERDADGIDRLVWSGGTIPGISLPDPLPPVDNTAQAGRQSQSLAGRARRLAHSDKRFEDFRIAGADGGPHWLRLRATTAQRGDTTVTTLILSEVTEEHRMRREIREQEARLQQGYKMESLGTLAGGVAHDFNNILQPVVMFAEDVKDALPADSPSQESLNAILTSAERAADLIRRILDFSRPETDTGELLDITGLVEDALQLVARTLPSSIELDLDVPENIGDCCMGATEMTQILTNLAVNAADAMDGQGTLRIRLTRTTLAKAFEQHGLRAMPGHYAVLTVEDTGPGMPSWLVDKIFEPFFTTKDVGEGTGLGLSAVHGLLRQHAGALRVRTAPGEGAGFDLYIPVSAPEDAERAC